MNLKRRLLYAITFGMFTALLPCPAQALSVNVSGAEAEPGSTGVAVTIDVDNATGIAGGDFTLTYDSEALTAKQASPASLFSGMLVSANLNTAGEVRIAVAGDSGIPSGSGALLTLAFDVNSNATVGSYELKLARAEFHNEQGQALSVESITSGTLTIAVSGSQPPTPGEGIKVNVSDAETEPGATGVPVTIGVNNATGIAGGDFTLTYDSEALTAKQASPGSLFSGMLVSANLSTPGEVRIAVAGDSGIPSGSGAVITLTFDVGNDAAVGSYELKLTRAEFHNEQGQALSVESIASGAFTVTVTDTLLPPVANFTWTQDPDTLLVVFTDQSTNSPTSWSWDFGDTTSSTEKDPTHEYQNAGTYIVSLTVTNTVGSDTRKDTIQVEEPAIPGEGIKVNVGDAEAESGATDVPVTIGVDNATGIAGGDFTLTYDSEALTAKQASPASLFSGMLVSANLSTPGEVRIAVAGDSGIPSGSGAVITLTFDVGSEAAVGSYELKLTRAEFHNEQGQALSVESIAPGAFTVTVTDTLLSPVANFTSSPESGPAPLKVRFADQSTNNPTSWSWDFGDTTTSTEKDATHEYQNAGTYIVSLTATNTVGSDTRKDTIQVEEPTIPGEGIKVNVGDAEAEPGATDVPITIGVNNATGIAGGDFTLTYDSEVLTAKQANSASLFSGILVSANLSTPGEVRIAVAGDSGIPSGSGAVITLTFDVGSDAAEGSYELKLTRAEFHNEQGQALSVESIASGAFTVTVTDTLLSPVAGFTWTKDSDTLLVTFTDQSTNSPASWLWDFGDTTSSTEEDPTHEYQNPGTYIVSLTVTSTAGSDTKSDSVVVLLVLPPVADFTWAQDPDTLLVVFTDQSTNSPTSWSWDFGDTTSSTEKDPTHEYQNPGAYIVSLAVSNAAGSDATRDTVEVKGMVTIPIPVAAIDADIQKGTSGDGENTQTQELTSIRRKT